MRQKRFYPAMMGCVMFMICVLGACSASVENTPEAVATLAIKHYMNGTLLDVKEYASQDEQKSISKWNQETIDAIKELYKDVRVEFDKVSDYAADGSIKDVSFKAYRGERGFHISVRVVNENGKWLFDSFRL